MADAKCFQVRGGEDIEKLKLRRDDKLQYHENCETAYQVEELERLGKCPGIRAFLHRRRVREREGVEAKDQAEDSRELHLLEWHELSRRRGALAEQIPRKGHPGHDPAER